MGCTASILLECIPRPLPNCAKRSGLMSFRFPQTVSTARTAMVDCMGSSSAARQLRAAATALLSCLDSIYTSTTLGCDCYGSGGAGPSIDKRSDKEVFRVFLFSIQNKFWTRQQSMEKEREKEWKEKEEGVLMYFLGL